MTKVPYSSTTPDAEQEARMWWYPAMALPRVEPGAKTKGMYAGAGLAARAQLPRLEQPGPRRGLLFRQRAHLVPQRAQLVLVGGA